MIGYGLHCDKILCIAYFLNSLFWKKFMVNDFCDDEHEIRFILERVMKLF